MAMVSADGSSHLSAQIGWFGLRVGGHPALSLHSSNEPGELSQWLALSWLLLLLSRAVPSLCAGTARRRPTYSVKLRLWKVSTFYFKIVAIPTPLTITITPRRQTHHCLLISLRTSTTLWPSTLWNRLLFSSFRTTWKRLHVHDDVRQ